MRVKLDFADLAAQADRLREAGLGSAAEQAGRAWACLAQRSGRTDEVLLATNFLVRLALDRQEPRLALRYGEEALGCTVGTAAPEPALRARLHLQLAKAAWRLGWLQRMEAYSDAADVCAQETPLPPRLAGHAALVRGLLAAEAGRLDRAASETRRARTLALECGDHLLALASRHNLGWLVRRMGDLEGAERHLLRLVDEAVGATRGRVLVELAGIALERGDIALAMQQAQAGLDAYRQQPARLDELDLAPLYGLLGRLSLATGRDGQARRLLLFGAHWYDVAGRPVPAAALREEAARCRRPSGGAYADALLEYVGDLVTLTLVYGARRSPEHHLRRVALLAERFGRPSGPCPAALQHAALLHELPQESRWFCQLCDEGRNADRILSQPDDPDRALLQALDSYETDLAGHRSWQRALERVAPYLDALGHPATDHFRLAHLGA